jgi:uncharacterized Rmd1/YagE family protein
MKTLESMTDKEIVQMKRQVMQRLSDYDDQRGYILGRCNRILKERQKKAESQNEQP